MFSQKVFLIHLLRKSCRSSQVQYYSCEKRRFLAPEFLVFFGQQSSRHGTISFGDDPDLHAFTCFVC